MPFYLMRIESASFADRGRGPTAIQLALVLRHIFSVYQYNYKKSIELRIQYASGTVAQMFAQFVQVSHVIRNAQEVA